MNIFEQRKVTNEEIQAELFDCQRLILKTSLERNMKAAVINKVI